MAKKGTYLVWDIETYKSAFIICAKTDSAVMDYVVCPSVDGYANLIDCSIVKDFLEGLKNYEWHATYNGKSFDIRVLSWIATCGKKTLTTEEIHDAANLLIDEKGGKKSPCFDVKYGYMKKIRKNHIDVLKVYTQEHGLKKWELFRNWSVRESNVSWDAETMTPQELEDCIGYCHYDVSATTKLFLEKDCQELIEARQWVIDRAPCEIMPDVTSAELAELYCYGDDDVVDETEKAYELIPWDEFDVPYEFLLKMKQLASHEIDGFRWNGIDYGAGGAHFAKKGKSVGTKIFDVASLYPNVIANYVKLKTDAALKRYIGCIDFRLENKRKKGTPDYSKPADIGVKKVLNSLSGKFGMPGAKAYAPEHRLAMCLIGQITITEAAIYAIGMDGNWDDLIEINTDSFAVNGDENIKRAREYCAMKKHGFTFEEDNFDESYWKDVNHYFVYNPNEDEVPESIDKQNKFVKERHGDEKTNLETLRSELIVTESLIRNVRFPQGSEPKLLDIPVRLEDYLYKYVKPASAKNAAIDGVVMDKKYYYFLWVTEDCPAAKEITFNADKVDKYGLISSRRGVVGFSPEEIEPYLKFVDKSQYLEDLKRLLCVWGREDMVVGDITGLGRAVKNASSFAEIQKAREGFFNPPDALF